MARLTVTVITGRSRSTAASAVRKKPWTGRAGARNQTGEIRITRSKGASGSKTGRRIGGGRSSWVSGMIPKKLPTEPQG